MIADDELRRLFRAESDEHLGALESGLLALEQGRGDATTLDQVFRDAHSLKGAARMLELQDIEMLMHGMEELLRAARDQQQAPDAAALKALYAALDAARALVTEAVTGQPAGIALRELLDGFETNTAARPQAAAAPSLVGGAPSAEHVPAAAATFAAASADLDGDGSRYQIDTIRVDTRKLDDLLRLCGELIVTEQRTAQLEDGLERLSIELGELRQELLRAARGDASAMPWAERLAGLAARSGGLRDRLRDDSERLGGLTQQLADRVRKARLLPLSTLFALFPRMVRDLAQHESKQVELIIEGGATETDKQVIEQLKDPLMHVLRNAVHHGIEPPEQRQLAGKPACGRIRLMACRQGSRLRIEIDDDGRGVDAGQVRSALHRLSNDQTKAAAAVANQAADETLHERQDQLLESLFLPGLTTEHMITDVSGRGVGLDVVRTAVEALKGSLQAHSTPGAGFQLTLELPVTLATTRILLVQVGELLLGLPMDAVRTLFRLRPDSLYAREGRLTLDHAGQSLSVVELARALEPRPATRPDDRPDQCIVIGQRERQIALLVDAIVGAQEVLLEPLGGVLRRVPNIAGATILSSGEVCPVLAPNDLIKGLARIDPRNGGLGAEPVEPKTGSISAGEQTGGNQRRAHLLLVEDSMLTRVQEKRLLESAGYRVSIAVDGVEALQRLRAPAARVGIARASLPERFDAVITDVNMPRMDGLRLTEQIRADPRLRSLPVILVTSLASERDQRRGLDAGASAYITKGGFDNRLLLSTLERLI